MNKTKIEWVKNPDGSQGYTLNPITGCKYHTPDGMCLGGGFPCYAHKLANGRLKARYLANIHIPECIRRPTSGTWRGLEQGFQNVEDALVDPFYPRFWPERLAEMVKRNDFLWTDDIARIRKMPKSFPPRGIFVCDMSDLFGIGIPEEWTEKVLDEIWGNKGYDRFYLLTKQPQNLVKFSPFPDNCFVGVTVTNEHQAVKAVTPLMSIEAKVKYISHEPLLGRIRWERLEGLVDWLIIGAQTKPCRPPKLEWVEEIVQEAADKAGIPVFLKDNLWPLFDGSHSAVPLWAFGKDSRLRQEMPKLGGKADGRT